MKENMGSLVHHPRHYTSHPSGIECIEIVRELPFNHGCVFKYVFRRDGKEPLRSLQSAQWYLADLMKGGLKSNSRDVRLLSPLFEDLIAAEPSQYAKKFYRAFYDLLLNQCHSTWKRCSTTLDVLTSVYDVQSIAKQEREA